MKTIKFLTVVMVLLCCASSEGAVFGRRRSTSSTRYSVPAGHSNQTAQGVAEIQARMGKTGHFGGNYGYEGCGSGSTPQQALNNCCYSNSGMAVVDQGVAQGANGQWYACKRYR